MPIHYEQDDEHVVLITIDRPEARNSADMEHFKLLREAWERFAADDEAWVAIITGVGEAFFAGADLKSYIPEITKFQKQIAGGGPHRDQRLPPRRRHAGGAAQLAALQADHRRGERVLHRRRHGDARRRRHPRRVSRGEVRGHGAEARPVRGRRHHGAAAAPDPVAAGDGVPALRRPHPGAARVRDGPAQRGRPAGAAARHGARVRAPHHRERAARGAGHEAERARRVSTSTSADHADPRRGEGAARPRRDRAVRRPGHGALRARRSPPTCSTAWARSCAPRSRRKPDLDRRSSRPRTRRKVRRPSPRSARRSGKRKYSDMAIDPRTPCIIGVGQQHVAPRRRRRRRARPSRSTCGSTSRGAAADDSGVGARLLEDARRDPDRVLPDLAVRRRGRRGSPTGSGATPKRRYYSGIGGTTTQQLVQDARDAMLAGEVERALHRERRGARHAGGASASRARRYGATLRAGREAAVPVGGAARSRRGRARGVPGLAHVRGVRQRAPRAPRRSGSTTTGAGSAR